MYIILNKFYRLINKMYRDRFYNNKNINIIPSEIQLFTGQKLRLNQKDKGLSYDLTLNKGIREPYATLRMLDILKEQKLNTFLDIGANIGYYSVILGPYFNKVVCVEPEEENIKYLKQNIKINNIRAEIVEGAVTPSGKDVFINDSEEFNLIKVADHGKKIKGYQINKLTNGQIDFIKMDIEGYEYDIITNHPLLLYSIKPKYIFLELHVSIIGKEKSIELLKVMDWLGYKINAAIIERRYNYSPLIQKLSIKPYNHIFIENKPISKLIKDNKILSGYCGNPEIILERKPR